MGDDKNITEIDVRLRNDNGADVEGDADERMRLRVTRKGSSGRDSTIKFFRLELYLGRISSHSA